MGMLSTQDDTLILLHDANCAVSQEALAILQLAGRHPVVRRYGLPSEALSRDELRAIARRLIGDPVDALVRRNRRYDQLGLRLDGADIETVVSVLDGHPELLQCPILDDGERAMIVLPLERAEACAITGHVLDTPHVDAPLLYAA